MRHIGVRPDNNGMKKRTARTVKTNTTNKPCGNPENSDGVDDERIKTSKESKMQSIQPIGKE